MGDGRTDSLEGSSQKKWHQSWTLRDELEFLGIKTSPTSTDLSFPCLLQIPRVYAKGH